MTYQEFSRSIIESKVTDWLETTAGYVFIPDISIMLRYHIFDASTMEHVLPVKDRFPDFIQAGKYEVLYHGTELDSMEFAIVRNNQAVDAIPFEEGITEDDELFITPLEYRICRLITELIGSNSADEFDDALRATKVVVKHE